MWYTNSFPWVKKTFRTYYRARTHGADIHKAGVESPTYSYVNASLTGRKDRIANLRAAIYDGRRSMELPSTWGKIGLLAFG